MDISFFGGNTLAVAVPKRPPVTAPKFGAWLQLQRGDRSLEQIAQRVRPLVRAAGLKVDQSLIYKVEQGRVPNWPLLAALGQVYGISMEEMTQRLGAAIEFEGRRDLIRHSTDQTSDPHPPGGANVAEVVAAHARIQQQHQDLLAATEAVAMQLADTLVAQGVKFKFPHHDAGATTRQSRTRKRPRKTG